MRELYINGRFCNGDLNGVHRVATRLIEELDVQLQALPAAQRPRAHLLLPAQRRMTPSVKVIQPRVQAGRTGQLWEHTSLPWQARGGVLLNLCNLAPLAHRRQILMLHDAQFLMSDCSYPTRQRLGYRWLIPWMARAARHVVTVSYFSRQILDVAGIAPLQKVTVIHNGVDHLSGLSADDDWFETTGLPPRGFAVHFASRKAYKNTRIVLEAFCRPALHPLKLVLVGDGVELLQAEGMSLPPNATHLGRISDEQLKALYQNAVCLLFPSRTEGFGLPPLEAMRVGCPAVVAPSGAIPEACRNGALYAGVDDVEAWADAVVQLWRHPATRHRWTEAGLEASESLTWETAGRRLLELVLDHCRA
jgi:glycosyltransferase involved in cell wall biosynthesis